MAVVSDTVMCNKIAPFYVSSSAYYGYVPPNPGSDQFGRLLDASGDRQQQLSPVDGATRNRCSHSSAMETDDDGYERSGDTRCLNNHCVIPEDSRCGYDRTRVHEHHLRWDVDDRHASENVGPRRRNRKRTSTGDLVLVEPTVQLKRFREGGGNGRVYRGTGSPKERGLATVHHESSSLRLSSHLDKNSEQTSGTIESCCWAAGNYSLISKSNLAGSISIGGSKLCESDADYEKMLLETHGLSVYHHHRQQLVNGNAEVEF